MNNEFSCSVTPRNKVAKYVLGGLLGSSAIFVTAAILTPKYSGLVWMVAFIFIVASIFVYNRYVGAEFCYSVERLDGHVLIISQKVGNTVKTMARLDIESIEDVRYLTYKELRAHKCPRDVVKYSYYPTMHPAGLYLVFVRSRYEVAEVLIDVDETFASALKHLVDTKPEGYDA